MNKIVLGTVQFGLDYGVINTKGQVQVEEVEAILECAKENCIDTLDTSSGYGNSEEVLWRVGVNNFRIVTKTTPLQSNVSNVLQS